MIRTQGVSHVRLAVQDLDRTIEFYGDTFGFELVRRRDLRARLQIPTGGGWLDLEEVEPAAPVRTASFGLALVDPADLEAAIELAVAGGGQLLRRARHVVGGASAEIADPDGHRIAL